MYRKDYVMRMAEDFAKLLGLVFGFKLEGDYKEAEETVNEALKKFSDSDISFIMNLPEEELLKEFVERRKLNEEEIHIIAELLFQQGEIQDLKGETQGGEKYFRRSYLFYLWLMENQRKTFSVEIAKRTSQLQEILNIS